MAETRQKATFNLVDKPEFPSTHDGMIITSRDLSKHVNALMTRIFADYSGCRIYVDQGSTGIDGMPVTMNQNHPVQLELYFNLGNHVDGEKRLYAFRPIVDSIKDAVGEGKKRSYIAQALGHNVAITQNKSSEITDDGIDILSTMLWYEVAARMSKNPTSKEFNKKGIIVEASTANGNTPYMTPNAQRTVYNVVRYVDICSILAMLFEDDNKKLVYSVTPIKPIMPMAGGYVVPNVGGDQKWLFNVSRINQETFFDLCNEIGTFSSSNGLNITTDTY